MVNLFIFIHTHYFIYYLQSIYETLDKLNVPREKAHLIMNKYGYTGSASIGMCLGDAVDKHMLKKGDLCVFLGSGGGMSMTALALEWSYNT